MTRLFRVKSLTCIIWLLLLALSGLGVVPAPAAPRAASSARTTPPIAVSARAAPRIAIVVLLRPATLDDWRSAPAPNLHWLLENGAGALMNTRAARVPGDRSRESLASAALTLGAGARAACGVSDGLFVRAGDLAYPGVTAQDLHERRTGQLNGGDALLAPNWPRVLSANRGVGYRVTLGSLGAALQKAGVRVAATPGPFAPLVAANEDGIAGAPISSEDFLWTDPQCDAAAFLDDSSDWAYADHFVGEAIAYSAAHDSRIIVLSPGVNDNEYKAGNRLAPLIIFGPGVTRGLLTSRSTRTPGLIANTDFAGFVAGYFHAALPGGPRAMDFEFLPTAHPAATLAKMQAEATDQRRGMTLLPPFAVAAGLLIACVTLLRARGFAVPDGAALLPAAAIAAFALSHSITSFLFAFLILLGATAIGARRAGTVITLGGLCAVLWLAAVLHMLAPHGLLKYSLLGYSIIEGARYYGIGNEMMGALTGAVLVAAASAKSRRAGAIKLVLVLATMGMVGWPQIGAKAGGVIVSVGTLLVYFGSLRGVRWGAGRISFVVGAAITAVLIVAFLDSHFNSTHPSHMGRAVMGLGQSGIEEWTDIVTRKLAVEGRLLWRSAWAIPLWSALAGILFLRGTIDAMDSVKMRAIYRAGLAAILLSIAFNDAGAVAGALCAMLLWTYLILVTKGRAPDQESAARP